MAAHAPTESTAHENVCTSHPATYSYHWNDQGNAVPVVILLECVISMHEKPRTSSEQLRVREYPRLHCIALRDSAAFPFRNAPLLENTGLSWALLILLGSVCTLSASVLSVFNSTEATSLLYYNREA